ncbi:unnamed protein product [Strongylus vulgaris]|uniref:AMP-dependent synthetase/ligase domain-containing protein n=1 Tax=Strongylus vulgaris TaxID=40348 RepID=A0A3P7IDE0_STRVU|nr:unnamed protein product [Strongylus vulgaris]
MQGYLSGAQVSSNVVDADGWFHTGDIGMMDHVGQTVIVDRQNSSQVNASMWKENTAEQIMPF